MSIMTNCGLLCLSPKVRRQAPDIGLAEWILLFVFLEHLLIGLRYLLHITIPDKPEWVRVALARRNYESKQALKFEVSRTIFDVRVILKVLFTGFNKIVRSNK